MPAGMPGRAAVARGDAPRGSLTARTDQLRDAKHQDGAEEAAANARCGSSRLCRADVWGALRVHRHRSGASLHAHPSPASPDRPSPTTRQSPTPPVPPARTSAPRPPPAATPRYACDRRRRAGDRSTGSCAMRSPPLGKARRGAGGSSHLAPRRGSCVDRRLRMARRTVRPTTPDLWRSCTRTVTPCDRR